jgi:hypothetical protein
VLSLNIPLKVRGIIGDFFRRHHAACSASIASFITPLPPLILRGEILEKFACYNPLTSIVKFLEKLTYYSSEEISRWRRQQRKEEFLHAVEHRFGNRLSTLMSSNERLRLLLGQVENG